MSGVKASPFSDRAVNAAIEKSLAEVPEGHTVAFVAALVVKDGNPAFRTVVNVRLDEGWSFAGVLEAQPRGPFTAAAELRFSR